MEAVHCRLLGAISQVSLPRYDFGRAVSQITEDQVSRAINILRSSGIDTAEKFEALLQISEARVKHEENMKAFVNGGSK